MQRLLDDFECNVPLQTVATLRNDLSEVRQLVAGRKALGEEGVAGLLGAMEKLRQIVRIVSAFSDKLYS